MTLIVQSNSFQLFDGKVDADVSEVNKCVKLIFNADIENAYTVKTVIL